MSVRLPGEEDAGHPLPVQRRSSLTWARVFAGEGVRSRPYQTADAAAPIASRRWRTARRYLRAATRFTSAFA